MRSNRSEALTPPPPTCSRPPGPSIGRQLTLLIWVLLAPIVVGFALWVHTEVRRDSRDAAIARVRSQTHEIANALDRRLRVRIGELEACALRDDVRRFVTDPHSAAAPDSASLLRATLGASSAHEVLIWHDGEVILRCAHPDAASITWPQATAPAAAGPGGWQRAGDCVMYEMAAAIPDGGPADFLVVRRAFREGAAELAALIGDGVHLLLGNADHSLWTDLASVVPAPERGLPRGQALWHTSDGNLRIGATVALGVAPWLMRVDVDGSSFQERSARRLLRQLGASVLLLVLGGLGARWIGRRVSAPVAQLTAAVEDVAAGHYGRRVRLDRNDEFGWLATAFDTMAAKVEDAHHQLEVRVDQRTADLRSALERLHATQDELVRSERLALLGQLAGSVGHELRNPLGVMSNAVFYLEMILEDSGPEVREYLGILRRQISLSEKITSDLLDFTRHRPPQVGEVPLRELVAQQIERLGPLPTRFVVDVPDTLPPAFIDRVQIAQVLFNLLTNAVQAVGSRADGCIELRATFDGGHEVRLEVSDNGSGVPDELRERIFEPLFTTRARGIGLGLAVSRQMAQNNGGDLQLAPARDGAGATFTLLLRAVPAMEHA